LIGVRRGIKNKNQKALHTNEYRTSVGRQHFVIDDMSDLDSEDGSDAAPAASRIEDSRNHSQVSLLGKKHSSSEGLSGADLARRLQSSDRVHFDDSDEDEDELELVV
jgi:hypothetical protein